MSKRKKKFLWIIPVLLMLVVAGGTYAFGYYYAGSHFLPNTTIDGKVADGKTPAQMNLKVLEEEVAPSLTIIEKNLEGETLEETLDLQKAAGFTKHVSTDQLLKEQNRTLWFLSFFQKTELQSNVSEWQMNESMLLEAVDQLYAFQDANTVEPKNAYLEYSDGTFQIVPAEDGLKLDRDGAREFILQGVKAVLGVGGQDLTLDLTPYYQTAEIREDNEALNKQLASCQKVTEKTITITIPDNQNVHGTETLAGAKLMELLTVENLIFSVNQEAVEAYVKALAEKYDLSQYEYLDQEQLVKDLSGVLLSEKNETVTAAWAMITPPEELREEETQTEESEGSGEEETTESSSENESSTETAESSESSNTEESSTTAEEPEEKETCIYVSIKDQYLWYYKDGELIVSCPIVTGNPNGDPSSQTPTGTYEVLRIAGASTLAGADYVEYVDYWIGFDYETGGGMLGFHDASWRDEFGGEIYLTDPSHGCVNMPTWAVATMWEVVEYGTKVVIY